MKGLLEKIVSTKSSSMDLLSSEDRSFIEKQEALLAKLTSQLNAWKVIMDKGAADLPSSPLVHLNKEWGNWRASKNVFHDIQRHKKVEWADASMFSPAYAQAYINEMLEFAPHRMVTEIIGYFNVTYNLNVSPLPQEYKPNAEEALEWVMRCQRGMSLQDARTEATIAELQLQFPSVSIEGNKLTIPASKRWTYDSLRGRTAITKSISLFENGHIQDESITSFFKSVEKPNELYTSTTTDKFKSVRFYKNGKTELKFINSEAAKDFYAGLRLKE
jgi:hypothetical protein